MALYERVRFCLNPSGRLVIHSPIRDRQAMGVLFGVQMLVVGNGGDAHPEALYRDWLARCGYGHVDVVDIEDGRRTVLLVAPFPLQADA